MQFLKTPRKQLLGEYLFWKVRWWILNFSLTLVELYFCVLSTVLPALNKIIIVIIFGYPKKYPNEVLESLSPEVLSERLKKFYQELRKSPTEHYSASAHLFIRAAIDRYLNTLPEFSGISFVRDSLFKIANKSLSAKLKQLKAQGFAKVQHHPSISPEDIQKCHERKVFSDETPISLLRVNWFNISLHFCRRGRENLRSLTPDSFFVKKVANYGEYVEMSISEKKKKKTTKAVSEIKPTKVIQKCSALECQIGL